ncbi:MAG: hypothetical protein RR653_10585 [Clostridia bacterium]
MRFTKGTLGSHQIKQRTPLRGLCRLFLFLLCGVLVGFTLLVAAFALPVDAMERNVLLSIPTLDGSWGTGEEAYEQLLKGYATTQLDNTTDALMLLTAIHRSNESLITQAVNVYTYSGTNPRAYPTLLEYAQTGAEGMRDTAISWYWLGYLVLLKPLLMVFTYMDLRMLNMLLQGLLLIGILVFLQKRGLSRYVLPFGLSLVCLTPMVLPFSFQFSTMFYISAIAMLLLLYKTHWVLNRLGDAAFFLLIGMSTAYFDFLTYPIASFGIPFLLLLLLKQDDKPRALWRMLLRCGAAWSLGYGGMWVSKWLLTALLSNEPILDTLLAKITERTSLVDTTLSLHFTRMDVLKANFAVFAKKPYLLLGAGTLLCYAIAYGKRRSARRALSPALALLFLCVAFLPIAWYLLFSNHSFNHAFFTSRTLWVSAFSILCLLSRFCEPLSDGGKSLPYAACAKASGA